MVDKATGSWAEASTYSDAPCSKIMWIMRSGMPGVDASQRPVPVPQVEVLPDGAARRQVLRQRLPLTPRPEHIKDRVEDLTNVHCSRAAAALCRTDQRSHQRPFGLRQITLVTQAAPVGGRSMFRLPHEAPPNQVPFKESQAIPATQVLSGTALRASDHPGKYLLIHAQVLFRLLCTFSRCARRL